MNDYAILRRSGWKSPGDLEEAAGRSSKVGDEQMSDDIRWIRSYVLEEGGGSVGTVCIYQATSPEAIEKHAEIAQLPVDEIIPVADTVVVRPDPEGLGGYAGDAASPGSRRAVGVGACPRFSLTRSFSVSRFAARSVSFTESLVRSVWLSPSSASMT